MVAAGDHARPARRAQRRRVHVVVAQPIARRGGRGSASRSDCRSSPSWPKPVSSSTMNSTFGAPFGARTGAGHAGVDSSAVRPITPGKAVPDGYSFSGISTLLFADHVARASRCRTRPRITRQGLDAASRRGATGARRRPPKANRQAPGRSAQDATTADMADQVSIAAADEPPPESRATRPARFLRLQQRPPAALPLMRSGTPSLAPARMQGSTPERRGACSSPQSGAGWLPRSC